MDRENATTNVRRRSDAGRRKTGHSKSNVRRSALETGGRRPSNSRTGMKNVKLQNGRTVRTGVSRTNSSKTSRKVRSRLKLPNIRIPGRYAAGGVALIILLIVIIFAVKGCGVNHKTPDGVVRNLIEAYDLLMEFVAKHTSDKFCLIDNVNTSIRGIIAREVIGNILVHRDYSSAFPAKVIIEKDWLKTENWCIPRRHGNIMSDEFTPYPKNPLIQQFFANIGRTDTIGSGVRNLYKYTPIYSDGGKPELIEDDVFRITIPLDKMAADEAREQKTLSEREQKIYNMICENIHLSVEQVMAELDISRATVFRDYAKIKKVTGAMYDKKTSTWTL